jgi:hypothetical protein
MALAAADTDWPGAMQTGAADMMSRTFLTVLHLLLIRITLPPGAGRKRQVNAGLMIVSGEPRRGGLVAELG